MNTTYLIIGAIALGFIGLLSFLTIYNKRNNQKIVKHVNKDHSYMPLSEEQKRLITFGAILTYYRGEKILGIKPQENLTNYANGLMEVWEVSNEAEAKETLNDLLDLKRSNELDQVLNDPSSEINSIQKRVAKSLGIEKSDVEEVRCTYAWDICRAVSLAKWCYWLGYLNEQEFWEILRKGGDIAVSIGKNWQEYTISFLLGRTIQGFDLDDLDVSTKQLYHSKNPLLAKVEDIDVYTKYKFKN